MSSTTPVVWKGRVAKIFSNGRLGASLEAFLLNRNNHSGTQDARTSLTFLGPAAKIAFGGQPIITLPVLVPVTASSSLVASSVVPVNATAAVTMGALPALSGLAVDALYAVQNMTSNTVTVPFATNDTTLTGKTSLGLTMPGVAILQVVAAPAGMTSPPASGKMWRVVIHVRGDDTLDARYEAKIGRTAAATGMVPTYQADGSVVFTAPPFEPILVPTLTKTAAFTARNGDLVVVNISGGDVPITCPATTSKWVFGVRVKTESTNLVYACNVVTGATGDTLNDVANGTVKMRTKDRVKIFSCDGAGSINVTGGDFPNSSMTFEKVYTLPASSATKTGTIKARVMEPCTLRAVGLDSEANATATALVADVRKNGTTVFTTTANRPQIAVGASAGTSGTPDITSFVPGDVITIDVVTGNAATGVVGVTLQFVKA